MLRAGELSAEQLLEHYLAQIHRLDPQLNSFVFIDEARARQAARDSDARFAAGLARSMLEGIPLSVKDNILVADMPATWGSKALADFVPSQDELPIAKLRAAGAVILGKTNVPELTLEGYTKNDLFGVTHNPWNRNLTPGGSSGGAVAGVAAGLVPAAIGTDGGGSIRRPASHTGLVGWKPSTGHIARIDGFASILTDFETIGTITHTVADALLLDSILVGPDQRDRRSCVSAAMLWPQPKPRIMYIPRFGLSPVDPEVAAATQSVADSLVENGYELVQAEVFFDLDEAAHIWHVVSRAGVAWLAAQDEGRIGKMAGAMVQSMAADGQRLTGADYIGALERVFALRRRCAELFGTVDLVLTPTAAALPWAADQAYPAEIDGKIAAPRDHAVFTGWVNIAGLPAISLPVAQSASGLPIGVQFVGGFGADAAVLNFAENGGLQMTSRNSGRHFLQIPGPTNVPDKVLQAIAEPTIDHRGPAFAELGFSVLAGMQRMFQTAGPVIIYPASGTGAWEAAMVNTLSPGDTVLMVRTGWFATLWQELAQKLGLVPLLLETDWRSGADPARIEDALRQDRAHKIRAVCVVHNETSTGCTSPIADIRAAIDAAQHPALLMVDTISSLASINYCHDAWGVDVTIAGSQKGLMLPPGLSFNAISSRAQDAMTSSKLSKSYWDWQPMLDANKTGYFPYTPATNLLRGLQVAIAMLEEEGVANVFARHTRHAVATRAAVEVWAQSSGIEVQCVEPRDYSSSLTAVRLPEGQSADALRSLILHHFNMSLGNGLGPLKDRVFRIGHLGALNDLSLIGALAGVEMGLKLANISFSEGGVGAAMRSLAQDV
eukprot:gene10665-10737_t